MNELHVKLDTDERSERPVEKTHTLYRRPEMFKVARAVELIRGASNTSAIPSIPPHPPDSHIYAVSPGLISSLNWRTSHTGSSSGRTCGQNRPSHSHAVGGTGSSESRFVLKVVRPVG